MSGLQERFTEAIADYLDLSGVEDYPHLCPDAVNPVHMAAAVIAALNLTEEHQRRNEYAARNGATPEDFTRWVTGWEPS